MPNPPPHRSDQPYRTVFVRHLMLDAYIGVYDNEQKIKQPIKIDMSFDLGKPKDPMSEGLEDILCYDKMTKNVKAIVAEGHIRLVETLAEKIAALALAHPLVLSVKVSVEKPDAIQEAAGVGVVIERHRQHP